MDRALLVVAAVAALMLLGLAVAMRVARVGRRELRAELDASRRDVAALQERLDDLTGRLEGPPERLGAGPTGPAADYVITTLPHGESRPSATVEDTAAHGPSAGAFASVALGESLVRVVSFGYGLRRAMSPANRNRIRFEMAREVKRARRQRRRDLKEARRHLRTADRSRLTEDVA
jgi:hypothetical protein